MAAAEHKASRRAVLGAAVALPLMGRAGTAIAAPGPLHHPAGDPPPRPGEDRAWRGALAAFEAAEAEQRAFERLTAGAPWEEQAAIDEAYGDRLDVMYAALRRLLSLPAPDLQALLTKVALVADHEVATLTGGAACMETLKRDAKRLAAAL